MKNKVLAAALYEGTFSVGTSKSFTLIDRNDAPRKNELKLSINPFLIRSGDRNILIDAGLGPFGPESHFPKMQENLEKHGLSEHDITDVIFSHLHFDHIGGVANKDSGYWQLSFPEATIHLSGREWEQILEKDQDDHEKSIFLDFIDAMADMNFLSDGDTPIPGVTVEVIGGHTEFSLAIFADFDDQKFVMAGDVLGTKGAVNRKYAAKYDFDGKQSMKMREYLCRRAFEEKRIFLTYHESDIPLFTLTDYSENKGYTIEAVNDGLTLS